MIWWSTPCESDWLEMNNCHDGKQSSWIRYFFPLETAHLDSDWLAGTQARVPGPRLFPWGLPRDPPAPRFFPRLVPSTIKIKIKVRAWGMIILSLGSLKLKFKNGSKNVEPWVFKNMKTPCILKNTNTSEPEECNLCKHLELWQIQKPLDFNKCKYLGVWKIQTTQSEKWKYLGSPKIQIPWSPKKCKYLGVQKI